MSTRRTFLKNGALTVAGATLFSRPLFALPPANEITGLQLYSVREAMNADAKGTLGRLAAMGYKYVEHAGYGNRKFYGYAAADFKKLLDGLGLKMPSGHTVLSMHHWDAAKNDFTDEWKNILEDASAVGMQYVISPALEDEYRTNYDSLLKLLDVFNKCGELCKKSGLTFGYHNHNFEFENTLNNQKLYDIILQKTDPALVVQQLDMGNMFGAGGRALDIIKRYPNRFLSMHVKDEIKTDHGEMNGYESTVLGKGVLPVKQIIDAGRKNGGTKLFIIEQESYQGKSPIDCVKEDLAVMKKWGY